jgi:2-amino-4-hydroxy-6-hydroxymethyldihydropteridine diphosphokinase
MTRSRLYRTSPVGGPPGQPDYLNAVVALTPAAAWRDPARLLDELHAIEVAFGRRRRVRWEARLLDLDLIALGDRVVDGPDLVLPHPRARERPFVLVPLLEVAPDWRDPRSGRRAADALAGLDDRGVRPSGASWTAR